MKVVLVNLLAEVTNLPSPSMILNMSLRMGQVAHSVGISTANGALLEVALQNITSRKGILAKYTRIRAVTSIYAGN